MAQYTVNMPASDFASTDLNSPNTTFKGDTASDQVAYGNVGGTWQTYMTGRRAVYFKFGNAPAGYERKVRLGVNGLSIWMNTATTNGGGLAAGASIWPRTIVYLTTGAWDPATVNRNNMPSVGTGYETTGTGAGWMYISAAQLNNMGGVNSLLNNGIAIDCLLGATGPGGSPFIYQVNGYMSSQRSFGTPYSGQPPFLEVIYDDLMPTVANASPASGLIDATASNRLSWSFNVGSGAAITPRQASFSLQWRDETGEIRTVNGGTDSSVTLPGDTFPVNQTIQWRVQVRSDDNISSDWTQWYILQPIDRTPVVRTPAPQSGFVDDSRANEFSWSLGTLGNPSRAPKQAVYEIEWRRESTGVVAKITGGTSSSALIPAHTFPVQERFSWRVRIQSDDDLWSAWTPWYELTTVNTAAAAIAISPRGEYLSGNEPIRFTWMHASPTGTPQSAWELQGHGAEGDWVTFAQGTGIQQQYLYDAEGFAPGAFFWRVRTKDATDTWGEWSEELENYIVAAPPAPAVNAVPNETMPLVSWQADEQVAYQLRVLDAHGLTIYDSAQQAGAGRQHAIRAFLASGTYTFEVRVQNQFGLWSLWGARVATLALPAVEAPTIECSALYGAVRVRMTGASAGARRLLYRDEGAGFIPIAWLDDTATYYDDYTCIGVCRYYVRSVQGGSYGDSNEATGAPDIRHTLVALATKPADMVALWLNRDRPPQRSRNTRVEAAFRHFEGRDLPVAEFALGVEKEHAYSFSSVKQLTPGAAGKLEGMVTKRTTMLIREPQGRKIFCVAMTMPVSVSRFSDDLSLTVLEIDHVEAVPIA